MREEYFVCNMYLLVNRELADDFSQRLQSAANDDWEIVRVPRPPGVPEWGVPAATAPEGTPTHRKARVFDK